ncbi:hypothetical protein D6779_05305 [Candidatus Parcubacteria bacterium]|nr:MAG: hypothetical protein D6779_05305 [Candidatus Parcubacteria bacterium]
MKTSTILALVMTFSLTGCATIHNNTLSDSEGDAVLIQAASSDGSSMVGGVLGGVAGLVLNFKKEPKWKCTNGLGQRIDCDTGEPLDKEKPVNQ